MFVKLPVDATTMWINTDLVMFFHGGGRNQTWLTVLNGQQQGYQVLVMLEPEEVALRLQGLAPVA